VPSEQRRPHHRSAAALLDPRALLQACWARLRLSGREAPSVGVGMAATTRRQGGMVKKTEDVEAFMDRLDHPFKAEVQKLREIIKGVSPDITEQIKWNAPTFSHDGD
jgi:hypothetical protein